MAVPKHKHRFKLKYAFLTYLTVGMALAVIALVLTSSTAFAAILSVTNPDAKCPSADASQGDYRLNPPQLNGGYSYYCIQGLTLAEVTLPVNGNCPQGIGQIQTPFGPGCLGNLQNPTYQAPSPIPTGDSPYGAYTCGGGGEAVKVSINLGCQGKGNPILDGLFAIIRFLSEGVGFVIIASTIVAGIQYSSSRGDPNTAAKAIERVRNNLIALLIFAFAYPLINWLIPAGLLK